MNPPSLPRLLVSVALALLAIPPRARAQEPAPTTGVGSVQGVVFDSTAGAPLPDAAVFLWGTPHRGVTDEEGRFRIPDVPAGEYTLLFYHARLGELGISPGPRLVTVRPGSVATAELGTPSWFTVVSTQCLLEERDAGTGTLAGWIGDGSTGMGLPRAKVTLSWPVPGSPQRPVAASRLALVSPSPSRQGSADRACAARRR